MSILDATTITRHLNAQARASHGNAMARPRRGVLAGWLSDWLQRRRTRRDARWLMSQPDYMLRDIGIGRAEIETVIRLGRGR